MPHSCEQNTHILKVYLQMSVGQHLDVTWGIINNAMGRQRKSNIPNIMIYNGSKHSGKSLADHFNQYFVSWAITSHTPLFTATKIIYDTIQENFYMQPTDEYEVYVLVPSLT